MLSGNALPSAVWRASNWSAWVRPCAQANALGIRNGSKAVDVAPGRQHVGVFEQVAAGGWTDIAAVERMDQRAKFVIGIELCRNVGAGDVGRGRRHCVDQSVARLAAQFSAQHMQPVRDQLALDFIEAAGQRVQIIAGDIERRTGIADHLGQIASLVALIGDAAIALDHGFQVGKILGQASLGQRRGQVADQGRARTALGDQAFGWVVRRIEIEIGQIADHALGPAIARQPGLLARHEFQRAVGAEMQHRIGAKIFA